MADLPLDLAPESAFAGLLSPVGQGSGVVVAERRGVQLASVVARKGAPAALAARLHERFGVTLPDGPKVVQAGEFALIGTGPGSWLAFREDGSNLAAVLADSLGPLAAVADQSSACGLLRLSGPHVRDVLAKGLDIDLHPRAFRPGDAAVTACAHIGIILWQVDAAPTYDIALFRSLAGSFWHWLADSAAEFGLMVEPAARG